MSLKNSEINFKGDNPGAVRYGNFINYYKFHPVDNRIKLLPQNVWKVSTDACICLDVGCNAGELTVALYKSLTSALPDTKCHFLGIDIDPTLITRAIEANKNHNIEYQSVDFMRDNQATVEQYLCRFNNTKFSVTFCFSITMWIHLNHGDDGLERFLIRVCALSEMVVIEPQPWKCYRTAVKRLRQSSADFPAFKELKYRGDIEEKIEGIITRCNFIKIFESTSTEWGRKIQIYQRSSS